MQVEELIKILSTLDAEAEVFVSSDTNTNNGKELKDVVYQHVEKEVTLFAPV